MRWRAKQSHVEWVFVGLLAAFCVALSLLQYHWTGQISRAEAEHLRTVINEQARLFCLAFDSTLTKSCTALVPRDEDLNDSNREAIHIQHFEKWKTGNPRPIFSRISVMVYSPGAAWLYDQDLNTGKFVSSTVPPGMNPATQNFSPPPRNGPPPFERNGPPSFDNYHGLSFPMFVGQSGNNRPPFDSGTFRVGGRPFETELMVFELDTNYLRNTWLPELSQGYLNPPGQSFVDIEVKTVSWPSVLIYSSSPEASKNSESPITVSFNREGREPSLRQGPGLDFSWILEARPHPGAIEAIVASARLKNLTVAILMNVLIFAAGLALVHHTRRSRQLAEAQMNFVATVSHELRTPLTVIRGAGHNLLHGVAREPGQVEQYSKLIVQHAEQLAEMVEQVLGYAGIQKNREAHGWEPVAVADLLREAASATEQDVKMASCQIQLDIPAGLPLVSGDAPALRRVFQNLITNAAKHGGAGRWIGITATAVAESGIPMVEIRVSDRGPGIPKSELSEIFKPFFRGAAAQSRQIRGSGLGLSLVKEIVEAHGGVVSAGTNPEGTGAVFMVRLPADRK